MSTLTPISSPESFTSHTTALSASTLQVIYFHAPWAAPCANMSAVLAALASTYPPTSPPTIAFYSINAEELPDLSEDFDVTAVPYIVLRKGTNTLDTISGGDATRVRAAVEKHATPGASSTPRSSLPEKQSVVRPAEPVVPKDHVAPTGTTAAGVEAIQPNGSAKNLSQYAPAPTDPATAPQMSSTSSKALPETATETKEQLWARLKELTSAAPCMLFMKGTPSAPQCGFSRQLVGILREHGVRYGFFNILADEDVRQGLKEYAEWPTFPQLWMKGELVGGLDIVKEEVEGDADFFGDVSVKKGVAA